VLCPFSCRGRSFCPSCEKKRQLLWAEWLEKEVLAAVPHRHVVLTMLRLLRGIFRKRPDLLLDLSQCAAEAIAEYVRSGAAAEAALLVHLGPPHRQGVSPPEKPPPEIRDVVRVPVDDEGREIDLRPA
jgi:hypothetical protein